MLFFNTQKSIEHRAKISVQIFLWYLIPTGCEERGVLGVRSIPVTILPLYYRKTRLHWPDDPRSEVGVEKSLHDPEGGGQGFFWRPTEDWGVVQSMLSSFAFIIPLNYGFIAKNNLSLQREHIGPYTFVLPVVNTTMSTCCYYQKYSTTDDFCLFSRI